MNAALVPIFAGAVAAALTALVTLLLGRRRASGTTATSEAADLWAASKALQEALSAELVGARKETGLLRTEAVALREETAVMREEQAALRAETKELRGHMAKLALQLEECTKHLTREQK